MQKKLSTYDGFLKSTLRAVQAVRMANAAFVDPAQVRYLNIDPDGFIFDLPATYKKYRFAGERVSSARVMHFAGGGDCDNFTAFISAVADFTPSFIRWGLKTKNGKAYHIYPIVDEIKRDAWRPYEVF